MNRQNTSPSDFKGFDGFVEIFRSGTHTDHSGNVHAWTNNDIDQIIANHSAADAAPMVIGHPAKDASSPAYGWAQELKRVGDSLFAKFSKVEPQFEQMVKNGQFKNRSVRILKNANGLRLGHVGWLGATPPAIAGLQPVEFAGGDEAFDFSMEWQSTSIIAKCMRNLRELFIEQYGQEKTDAVLPNYDIDALNRLSEQQYQDDQAEGETDPGLAVSSFSQQQDTTMTVQTTAELDAAKQQAASAQQQAADFAAQNQTLAQELAAEKAKTKRVEMQAIVDKHLQRGVKPALLTGAVDFMLAQDGGEAGTFEFSVGDGATQKSNTLAFAQALLDALPPAVKTGPVDFSGFEAVDMSSVDDITKAAQQYQFSESQAGRTISAADAVAHVTKGAK